MCANRELYTIRESDWFANDPAKTHCCFWSWLSWMNVTKMTQMRLRDGGLTEEHRIEPQRLFEKTVKLSHLV